MKIWLGKEPGPKPTPFKVTVAAGWLRGTKVAPPEAVKLRLGDTAVAVSSPTSATFMVTVMIWPVVTLEADATKAETVTLAGLTMLRFAVMAPVA